jgi:copper(I)-binding protein
VLAGAVLSGCGSSNSHATPSAAAGAAVAGRVADLEIVHPFLPDPPSPAVAAVYLTIRNTGATPDVLVAVSSPAAATSMLMSESGGAVGSMIAVPDLQVPAHGEASLVPGHDHVMLESPHATLKVGGHVAVTLRFRRAGPVTIEVPVVPLSALVDDDGGTAATTPGTMKMEGSA